MLVIFIKDHPAGIKEGRIINVFKSDADRWIEQGYVKEHVEKPVKKTKIKE